MNTLPRAYSSREIAERIELYTDARGYPPTVRDLARHLQLSPGWTMTLLHEARLEGLVKWEPGTARTLRSIA